MTLFRSKPFRDLASPSDVSRIVKAPLTRLLSIVENRPSLYGRFALLKKKGGDRIITPPRPELRNIQYGVKTYLDKRIRWPGFLHGGIEGHSIITNAEPHVGQEAVGNFDIQDFFPSTSENRVAEIFEQAGAESQAARLIASLCCFEGHLPQGSPTSMCLANLAFLPIDDQLLKATRTNRFTYTRFVDDITISGSKNLIGFKGAVNRLIRSGGYATSLDTLTGRNKPQIVTGIVVNDKMRPAREFVNHLKAQIRACWPENAGPELVADDEGFSVARLRNRFLGQIAHVGRFNKKLTREIRGLMVKVIWTQRSPSTVLVGY